LCPFLLDHLNSIKLLNSNGTFSSILFTNTDADLADILTVRATTFQGATITKSLSISILTNCFRANDNEVISLRKQLVKKELNNTSTIEKQVSYEEELGSKKISESRMLIYPNPVKEDLSIENIQSIKQVQLYDQIGRLVYSQNNEENDNFLSIKMDQFTNGSYILKLIDTKGVSEVRKIQVVR
jgi:Secretion system C-terminal sorting domain